MQIQKFVAAAILLSSSALAATVPAQADGVSVFGRALSKSGVEAAIEKEIKTLTPIIVADRDALLKALKDPKATRAQINAAFAQINKDLKAAAPDVKKLIEEAEKVGLSQKDIQAILKDVAPEIKQIFKASGPTVHISRAAPTEASVIAAIQAEIKKLTPIILADQKKLLAILNDPKATKAAIEAAVKEISKDLKAAAPIFEKFVKQALSLGMAEKELEKIFAAAIPEIKKLLKLPGVKVTVSRAAPTEASVIAAIEAEIKKLTPIILADQKKLLAILNDPKATKAAITAVWKELAKDLEAAAPIFEKFVKQALSLGMAEKELEKIFAAAIPEIKKLLKLSGVKVTVSRAAPTEASVIAAIKAEIKKLTPIVLAEEKKLIALLNNPKATQAAIDAAVKELTKALKAAAPQFEKLVKEALSLGMAEKELEKIFAAAIPEIKKLLKLPGVKVTVSRAAPTEASVIAAIEAEIKKLTPIILADQKKLLAILNDPKATKAAITAVWKELAKDLEAAAPIFEKFVKQALSLGMAEKELEKIFAAAIPEIKKLLKLPGVTVTVSRAAPTKASVEAAITKAIKGAVAELEADVKAIAALEKDPKATSAQLQAAVVALQKDLASLAPEFKKLVDQARAVGLTPADLKKILTALKADSRLSKSVLQFY
ncbi:hypothetical protein A4X13_0g2482 [Tilletia indica]|uniref:Uncharacterized protein n=1 Tax=Tilletia indica TaxID=43049 RepID=A0A177TUK6_9BASI|nr:hypothetical protein A4X13_0g2482 [Tilletia indica]